MIKFKDENFRFKTGFSLLEMIVYVSVMALIMTVIINTIVVIIYTQRDIKNLRAIEQSAIIILDRIAREIRDASSAVSTGNTLVLNTSDQSGNPKIVEFFINSDGVLNFKDGSNSPEPLIGSKIQINNLNFQEIAEETARVIKIEITLQAGQGEHLLSEKFYLSAAFRNS